MNRDQDYAAPSSFRARVEVRYPLADTDLPNGGPDPGPQQLPSFAEFEATLRNPRGSLGWSSLIVTLVAIIDLVVVGLAGLLVLSFSAALGLQSLAYSTLSAMGLVQGRRARTIQL